MKQVGSNNYANNQADIHKALKDKWGWKCERCGHAHDPLHGYALTVHHLDMDKSNNADWNLACLCQRCHLHIQGKVIMSRPYMFEHSEWFKPHVEGYNRAVSPSQ